MVCCVALCGTTPKVVGLDNTLGLNKRAQITSSIGEIDLYFALQCPSLDIVSDFKVTATSFLKIFVPKQKMANNFQTKQGLHTKRQL